MRGEKIIRDPVHDVIAFQLEREPDALLFRLINGAEFQRLRRIRQLGMASLAYPGADHSRYSHSLGVMQTARRMFDHLGRSIVLDEGQVTAALAASLLHDLGHGPFSHTFERVSGINHELLTQRIIADPQSDVHRILSEHDRQLPEMALRVLRHESSQRFYSDVLASQLDADRCDYLLRDNLMTGSRYGDFDLTWLLHALTVDANTNRLGVTWKGISAVEGFLQSRYHMYRNVYFHKVVRSAEGMVKLALQRARRLAAQDRLAYPSRTDNVYKALLGQRLDIDEFVDLDDVSVLHCLKLWTGSDDAVLAGLCRGLLFRGLYKTIDLSRMDAAAAQAAEARAMDAVRTAGGDPLYDLFVDEPADTPYESFSTDACTAGDAEITVHEPGGKVTAFNQLSPLTQALNRQLVFRRLHVSRHYALLAADAVGLSR